MKIDLRQHLDTLREGAAALVRRYPVETLLIVCSAIGWLICRHTDPGNYYEVRIGLLTAAPLTVLAVNRFTTGTRWRALYAVCGAAVIPLWLWPGLEAWTDSAQGMIYLLAITPLVLLLSGRATDNRRFASQLFLWIRAVVVSLFFPNLALLLFQAILWSTAYIFGFSHANWVSDLAVDVWILTETLAVPLLFVMTVDRQRTAAYTGDRTTRGLINRLFTPALLIYTLILYLYAAKILVLWTLPKGGVAWMVFLFALVTFGIHLARQVIDRPAAEGFYRRFSWVMLPAAALFWAGAARRIGEYGLTEWRVLLLACGVVMSAAVVLFFFRRTRRYWLVCLTALLCFAGLAFVPALAPQRLSNRSQQALFEEAARRIDLLDPQGALRWERLPFGDTTQVETCRRIDATLAYLSHRDTLYLNSLGLSDVYWRERDRLFTPEMQQRINDWEADPAAVETAPAGITCIEQPYGQPLRLGRDYRQLCRLDQRVTDLRDTLTIALPDGRVVLHLAAADLLHRQLTAAGIGADSLETITEEQRQSLLYYQDERIGLIFEEMEIGRNDTGEPVLHAARLGWLLER